LYVGSEAEAPGPDRRKQEEKNDQSPGKGEFSQLLASHQDVLIWFIRSLLPGSPDVDDILQETNLVLWKKWDPFETGTSFLNWVKSGCVRRPAQASVSDLSALGKPFYPRALEQMISKVPWTRSM
jgi:hypothetical protein